MAVMGRVRNEVEKFNGIWRGEKPSFSAVRTRVRVEAAAAEGFSSTSSRSNASKDPEDSLILQPLQVQSE